MKFYKFKLYRDYTIYDAQSNNTITIFLNDILVNFQ